ncbi:TonB-dependent receptor plug domain-containing protein [Flavobacteriaceae bacterium 14752]|uniref:TonB-dependent receptor plug domain-containing protein n=1 Tax=Mesohalobacter salilacus TaxID=2491711 RepID=UPI000F637CEC|nr:TonB-dependent receptor [Flavobacteriaceae bacterium 14752]
MVYRFVFILVGLSPFLTWAQNTDVEILDTVYLTDQQLRSFNTGQQQIHISDSIIYSQSFSLTDILQRESHIYFKQNGYGMVSSASFRGTTASQTAVVWNGININSALTGQADFNTLLSANFSSIDIKAGGGSVLYGSGAIGGSVHLNQDLPQRIEEEHELQTGYGSFNTFESRYHYQNQWENFKLKLAYARRQSDNDFDIPEQNRNNLNGQFEMNSIDATVALDLSKHHQLQYFGNYSFGERHFSLLRLSDPKTKFDNADTRNMLAWQSQWKNMQSKLKLAHLTENFTFYDNLDRDTSSSSSVNTNWLQYEFWIEWQKIKMNAVLNYQSTTAEGNQLENAQRDVAGVSFLFQHQLFKNFEYEITLRQDINDDFENPFLMSLGAVYEIQSYWKWRWHASKNYRLPGFNDLFWVNGGNTDLNPEIAYQTEFGTALNFKRLNFSVTGFYNDISDMIRWLPDSNGIWRPENTQAVNTYGVEASTAYKYKLATGQQINLKTQYSYTVSENQATGNQLIYVPFHQANANLAYLNRKWSVDLNWMYNGAVFTRTDNNPNHQVEDYQLFDVQFSWRFPQFLNSKLSLRALNILDLAYEAVDNRPMPGRSFSINLITQF